MPNCTLTIVSPIVVTSYPYVYILPFSEDALNIMKPLAEWIRKQTPEWTDEERYDWISTLHSWMVPACLFGFVFIENVFVRFFILVIQVITIVTEFAFRECIITLVEKEFSEREWDDLFMKLFKALGWNITRPEKMTFNIGLNAGLLFVFLLVLLRKSLLWILGISGIAVTALPTLVLFSKALHPPDIAELPLPQIHLV
jgi:hypothetical protein